jgi:hypothetical protein
MATPTVAVAAARIPSLSPIFFTTQQLVLVGEICAVLGSDPSDLEFVEVPGGALWQPW